MNASHPHNDETPTPIPQEPEPEPESESAAYDPLADLQGITDSDMQDKWRESAPPQSTQESWSNQMPPPPAGYYGNQVRRKKRYADTPEGQRKLVFGIIGLVLGVLSTVACAINPLLGLLALVGLVFGILAIKKRGRGSNALAYATIISNSVVLLLMVVWLIIILMILGSA